MGDYGIKISKVGSDVKTSGDIDTILTSKNAVLKGSISGSGTLYYSPGQLYIAHNLGYIPFAMVYVLSTIDTGKWMASPKYYLTIAKTSGDILVNHYCDATYLYIAGLWPVGNTANTSYRYYIFYDKSKI